MIGKAGKRRVRIVGAVFLVVAALAAMLLIGVWDGGNDMTRNVARASPHVLEAEPWPDQVRAVEEAWGEPIPETLTRIGGVDWWSWAEMRRIVLPSENGAPERVLFEGAYRDARVSYRGSFLYRHPHGDPVPADVFDRYVMSHLDDTALVFIAEADTPPVDWFELVPANPHDVRRHLP